MVDGAARRCAARAGAADGQAASPGADVPRGHPPGAPARDATSGRARAGAQGGRHAVHGDAGGLRGAALALQRAVRPRRGHALRGTRPARGGEAHRLLRQHTGAAAGRVRRPVLPGAAAPHARGVPRRIRPPGHALRAVGGRARARAGREPLAAVPGDVRPREHAAGGAEVAGRHRGGSHLRARRCALRHHPLLLRRPRWLGVSLGVQPRPLRRGDHPPLGGALHAPAGGRLRQPHGDAVAAAAADGRRAAPATARVERHGGPLPRPAHRARPLRGAGRTPARRHRRQLR